MCVLGGLIRIKAGLVMNVSQHLLWDRIVNVPPDLDSVQKRFNTLWNFIPDLLQLIFVWKEHEMTVMQGLKQSS